MYHIMRTKCPIDTKQTSLERSPNPVKYREMGENFRKAATIRLPNCQKPYSKLYRPSAYSDFLTLHICYVFVIQAHFDKQYYGQTCSIRQVRKEDNCSSLVPAVPKICWKWMGLGHVGWDLNKIYVDICGEVKEAGFPYKHPFYQS